MNTRINFGNYYITIQLGFVEDVIGLAVTSYWSNSHIAKYITFTSLIINLNFNFVFGYEYEKEVEEWNTKNFQTMIVVKTALQ